MRNNFFYKLDEKIITIGDYLSNLITINRVFFSIGSSGLVFLEPIPLTE